MLFIKWFVKKNNNIIYTVNVISWCAIMLVQGKCHSNIFTSYAIMTYSVNPLAPTGSHKNKQVHFVLVNHLQPINQLHIFESKNTQT